MKKEQYEKPVAEKIRFSIKDMLMDDGGDAGNKPGSSDGFTDIDPFSFKNPYQLD